MGLHFKLVTFHVNNLTESSRRWRKLHCYASKQMAVNMLISCVAVPDVRRQDLQALGPVLP
jgi:hypothetical protein